MVYQCMACGNRVGAAIKKEKAFHELGHAKVPCFDEDFLNRVGCSKDDYRLIIGNNEALGKLHKRDFFVKYNAYLESEKWQQKRQLVIDRAGGICEGCRLAKIDQVHHLTYRNVGCELLYQLVGLCSPCHEHAHNHNKFYDNEFNSTLTDLLDEKTGLNE